MQGLTHGLLYYILFCGIAGSILACPGIEIVNRAKWSAGASERVVPLSTPVKHIFIGHTVTPQCHTKYECSARMRSMQNYHKSIGWGDIGYNFVIGGDGRVYEGVGWNREGIHTKKWNAKSYGIAFVGNFMKVKPNGAMLRAARQLIVCGIKMGMIAEDRWLHGARDATCTDSPGNELYAIIKKWPRFQGGRLSVYSCP